MVRNDSTASRTKEEGIRTGNPLAVRLGCRGGAKGRSYLLPVRRDSRGDLAQSADKGRSGIGIGQCFQMHSSGELGRLRTEAYLQNILPPRRHQRVQFCSRILLPMRPRSQDDRARLVEIPLPPIALARYPPIVGSPAMPHYFEMEARRTIQIGFKGQCFLLPTPASSAAIAREAHEAGILR